MSALTRKLLRDLWHTKGQAVAISLVMASGIAMFVMSLCTLESLKLTRDVYYNQSRFAHVFASLKRAPRSLSERIAAIPGVLGVQVRTVADVTLDVEGMAEPGVGRLISVPDQQPPAINRIHLRRGRYIDPTREGEVVISESFADAHGFQLGDTFTAIINGRKEALRIVGVALSPEYVFQIRGGDLLPDEKRFGVMWIAEGQLGPAYDMDGAFNSVAVRLMRGASEADVIQQLDNLLEPYGSVGAYGRDRQLSARFVDDEIKQLKGMGMVTPSIFLAVTAFLLNIVVGRLIGRQREQIATIKAFGYSKLQIGLHYLSYVLAICISGVLIGCILGAWLGYGMTRMYTEFYRFPIFYFKYDWRIVLPALGIGMGAALIGTWGALRKAMTLQPAVAMRPEAPPTFRATIMERLRIGYLLPQTARMVLRELERRPLKALLSACGIAMAFSVLILGRFGVDAINELLDYQFNKTQRYDVVVGFIESTEPDAAFELSQLPGVLRCETFRSVAVTLKSKHRERDIAITGLTEDRQLQRLIDSSDRMATLPPTGLLMSDKLAEVLDLQRGDFVDVEVLEDKRPKLRMLVADVIEDYAGTNAYARMDYLNGMVETNTISGGHLLVDSLQLDQLYQELKEIPKVGAVSIKSAAIESFEEIFAENQLKMQFFVVIFACVIAFGVVYNTARISLAERSRELATLRVIGFTKGEVSAILLGELAVLTVIAIPLGMSFGYLLSWLVARSVESELYRLPIVISRQTHSFAAMVTVAASLISGLIVRRRVNQLDLVSVLKNKE